MDANSYRRTDKKLATLMTYIINSGALTTIISVFILATVRSALCHLNAMFSSLMFTAVHGLYIRLRLHGFVRDLLQMWAVLIRIVQFHWCWLRLSWRQFSWMHCLPCWMRDLHLAAHLLAQRQRMGWSGCIGFLSRRWELIVWCQIATGPWTASLIRSHIRRMGTLIWSDLLK